MSLNRINSSAIGSIFFAFTLCFLTACDDSTSASTASSDPVAEISSSSEVGIVSSSSVTDKGSSSEDGSVSSMVQSSGSVKSSSSDPHGNQNGSSSMEGKTDYSSSSDGLILSSSSSKAYKSCTSEEEGNTKFVTREQVNYVCTNGFWIPVSSSSVAPSSSSKYYDMSDQFNAKLSYGEFTDPRDGQVYKTIRYEYGLGVDSLTFFAENLNYGKMIPGGTQQGDSTKYCSDDDPWYCENGFGGLYTWATAMNFPAACDSVPTGTDKCPNTIDMMSNPIPEYQNDSDMVIHQGICPDGWHIMNRVEWGTVIKGSSSLDGGVYLGSIFWGNGNLRGFSLLPAGNYSKATFMQIEERFAYHWLPNDGIYKEDPLYGGCAFITSSSLTRSAKMKRVSALSIRCVQDY